MIESNSSLNCAAITGGDLWHDMVGERRNDVEDLITGTSCVEAIERARFKLVAAD